MPTLARPTAFVLAAVLAAPTLFATSLSLAHTSKTQTSPADGAVLASAPAAIEMAFDSPVRITLVELSDAQGDSYELDYVRGEPVTDFTAEPADLPSGRYTIEWRGLSADGHPTTGTFSFTID